jgi:hypothetical protein
MRPEDWLLAALALCSPLFFRPAQSLTRQIKLSALIHDRGKKFVPPVRSGLPIRGCSSDPDSTNGA